MSDSEASDPQAGAASPQGEESPAEEFYVERVLKKRYDKQLKMELYLIKWQDFSEAHNTWEPLANIEKCTDALRDFEERMERERHSQALQLADGRRRSAAARPISYAEGPSSSTHSSFSSPPKLKPTRKETGRKQTSPMKAKGKGEKKGRHRRRATISDRSSSDSPGPSTTPRRPLMFVSPGIVLRPDGLEAEEPDYGDEPFDPTKPAKVVIPAPGEDDGFDRGWQVERLLDVNMRPAAVGEGETEPWIVVKFKRFKWAHLIPMAKVVEKESKMLVAFLKEHLEKADFTKNLDKVPAHLFEGGSSDEDADSD